MKLIKKEEKLYNRELLDAIQQELGRTDIGIKEIKEGFMITDMDSKELTLTVSEENRIRALTKVKEKLE